MFLPEDKAHCFWAAEFQTARAASSANAGLSKEVQWCCQVPSSSSTSIEGTACTVKAQYEGPVKGSWGDRDRKPLGQSSTCHRPGV